MTLPDPPIQKVRCTHCQKITVGRVPKGGDGSVLFPNWHGRDGRKCPGVFSEGQLIAAAKTNAKVE